MLSKRAPFAVTILSRLAVVGALAVLPGTRAALAADCDADCGEDECLQSCEIDSISCSVTCSSGGCPGGELTCREYGASGDCSFGVTTTCCVPGEGGCGPIEQNLADTPGASGWAVLAFDDAGGPIRPDEVSVLASSSSDFASLARSRLAQRRVQPHRFRSTVEPGSDVVPAQERKLIWVDTGGPCAQLTAELRTRRATFSSPEGRRMVLFDVVTDGQGSILEVESLYSEMPDFTGQFVEFLRTNVSLWSLSSETGPYQAYIALMLDPDGNIGYALANGKAIR